MPNVGAKVKVTGTYAITFTKATADPRRGIMTVEKIGNRPDSDVMAAAGWSVRLARDGKHRAT